MLTESNPRCIRCKTTEGVRPDLRLCQPCMDWLCEGKLTRIADSGNLMLEQEGLPPIPRWLGIVIVYMMAVPYQVKALLQIVGVLVKKSRMLFGLWLMKIGFIVMSGRNFKIGKSDAIEETKPE